MTWIILARGVSLANLLEGLDANFQVHLPVYTFIIYQVMPKNVIKIYTYIYIKKRFNMANIQQLINLILNRILEGKKITNITILGRKT